MASTAYFARPRSADPCDISSIRAAKSATCHASFPSTPASENATVAATPRSSLEDTPRIDCSRVSDGCASSA